MVLGTNESKSGDRVSPATVANQPKEPALWSLLALLLVPDFGYSFVRTLQSGDTVSVRRMEI